MLHITTKFALKIWSIAIQFEQFLTTSMIAV